MSIHSSSCELRVAGCELRVAGCEFGQRESSATRAVDVNPKLETRNSKPSIINSKLETRNTKLFQAGFTLIELVLFIAIVGIAVAGVLVAYDYAARDSADPVVKKQALAIAESLLEEIQQMPFTFCDPNDPAVTTAASAAGCATPEAIGPEAGELRYSAGTPFDNVNDYNGLNTATDALPGIRQIDGTLIAGLGLYSAAVTVTQVALGGIPATDSLLITVTVTGPAGVTVTLDGYRTQYAPNL